MEDLSDIPLLKTSLATDSMTGGNQIWDSNSMKAPGGASGDLPPPGQMHSTEHPAPVIEITDTVPVSNQQSRIGAGVMYAPAPAVWKGTSDA